MGGGLRGGIRSFAVVVTFSVYFAQRPLYTCNISVFVNKTLMIIPSCEEHSVYLVSSIR